MRILCTQPTDPGITGLPPREALDYLTTLESHLARAESLVQIVCPFIDTVGADILAAAHDRSASRARWEVVTRKAPDTLRVKAQARGWHLYEFQASPEDEKRKAFHCKLFVFDEQAAILGSANLIYWNLVENVEIGVLLEAKDELAPLLAVPRALKRASRRTV